MRSFEFSESSLSIRLAYGRCAKLSNIGNGSRVIDSYIVAIKSGGVKVEKVRKSFSLLFYTANVCILIAFDCSLPDHFVTLLTTFFPVYLASAKR